MLHHLKTLKPYFLAVEHGAKRFEIRYNDDRAFQKGDTVVLHEFDPESWDTIKQQYGCHTGRTLHASITFVTNFMQNPGYVVFGFTLIDHSAQPEGE